MESYARKIRRELHLYPEVGFELEKTKALIKRELKKIGVPYTESYGKSSIVATVNEEKEDFTMAIRADTDALPLEEKNDVEYKSRNKGKMHACGHDAHTAIVLDTIRRINKIKDEIALRVKFFFQSAEEHTISGAKLMADDGVMDGIDCIAALHCDPEIDVGKVAVTSGAQNASSDGFYLKFYGKSAHVAKRNLGNDAIMMAMEAYSTIKLTEQKDAPSDEPYIFHVGKIEGGVTNNIVADECSMFCTLRAYSDNLAQRVINSVKKICENTAKAYGGRFEFITVKHYPIVFNEEKLTKSVVAAAEDVVGKENVISRERDMMGEDFSYFSDIAPGCMFRLGVRNEEKGITEALHSSNFDIDERALETGSDIFVKLITDKADELKEKYSTM